MKIICLINLLLLFSCRTQESKYPEQVGDIQFDSKLDDPNFEACNASDIVQYSMFNKGFQYTGEKYEIIKVFDKEYRPVNRKGETGYITIRFIVNCKGNTGLFRIESMNKDYMPKTFSPDIVQQLLSITKSLHGWPIGMHDGISYDYHQYLTFKIENGVIKEILP